MDLEAVRTFVAVADAGQFQEAAVELAVTQQAVSKRIAALERNLEVRLFTRTPRGAQLTIDGQAFLPHARELLRVADRAVASVRAGRRPLRVDVINSRGAASGLMRDFHRAHPEIDLDVMLLFEIDTAVAALRSGAIDASFRAVGVPGRPLPPDIESARVVDEPLQLLTGPAHALAGARSVTMAQLVGHRIWMPGIVPGTEWAAYYDDLVAEFGLTIEATGPNFGSDALLDTVADTPALATFMGAHTRLVWPADHGLRRIPVTDPTPVYPHALLWHRDNPHPALAALRAHLAGTAADHDATGTWTPDWTPDWTTATAR
ncbi:LysR family transcriptional regulator [Streptomyces noursei]|uniref:LysR family transcriptional regulator n=1 Tax=Streptomyces noursei TaxID=1971 RepID=A0A401QQ27_STRNR|nr:LysR family transcriptional regulator [Streptomyces noursei]EXU91240.1 LysR family transcriptional regulator [Streptomyces noursei PD-1]UWS76757.1 LysR family transcriptional regulator [Streptomyces noursei]GCB87486.1 LysR family transcriptional regulator [Streptomyces noursei]